MSYLHVTPARAAFWVKLPPFGSIILIATYLGFILGLEFTNNDYPGAQHYQALGLRAGWLAVSQIPLIVLLAGKNNLIGLFTGVGYERLNVYHRWVSRGLLILATMHFGFQSTGWNKYGLMPLEWDTDTCPPTGIAAYAILLFINFANLAPTRNLSYDFFVAQHVVTFFGFIVAIMIHLPTTALYTRVYIWIPIGLYLFDRTVRTVRYAINNISPGNATLIALDDTATKIQVSNKRIHKWSPGAHILLSIPRFGVLQSHPATILSTPSSHNGDLVFILRAHRGFTRRILNGATTSMTLPKTNLDSAMQQSYIAFVDGPYYSSHSDFAYFDTVALIAGGTGVTFTLSALLNLAERASSQKFPVRRIDFTWLIKKVDYISWIAKELQIAHEQLKSAGIEINIRGFVTGATGVARVSHSMEQEKQQDEGKESYCYQKNGQLLDRIEPHEERDINLDGPVPKTMVPASASIQLPSAEFILGRPNLMHLLNKSIVDAEGETAIGACGPLGLVTAVRTAVVKISDDRAVHKGTGAQGIYLHVESLYS